MILKDHLVQISISQPIQANPVELPESKVDLVKFLAIRVKWRDINVQYLHQHDLWTLYPAYISTFFLLA